MLGSSLTVARRVRRRPAFVSAPSHQLSHPHGRHEKAGLTDPVIEDKHAAALEKTISKASDASNSGKDFSFGSDDVPPEVKDMSTGHAISA